jgi:hypothetical protein
MSKKAYMKPTMKVVELKQRTMILAGSNEEVNRNLQNDEVDNAW